MPKPALHSSFIFAILGWIGYTLATTSPPKPIEEIEKESRKTQER